MLNKLVKTISISFFIFLFFQVSGVSADELGAFGSRIFQFQKKLALKGNTLAQYKLGTLYEFGVSVKPDPVEASNWYKKAAAKKYMPAINRLTYLEIKRSGFIESKHGSWFRDLRSQAESSEPNAIILLGQMSRYGIKVTKNLNNAVFLLEQASSLGHTEVDSEIDEIKREIEANQAKKQAAEKAPVEEKKKPQKTVAKKSSKKKTAKAEPKAKPKTKKKQLSIEEKRLKYEKAMEQIRKESLLMQQQQDWSEGE